MYKPTTKSLMRRKRSVEGEEPEEEEFYVSGSWESLMQGYGEIEWTRSKMIPIRRFVEDFDPNCLTWKEYEAQELEAIPEERLEAL